MASSLPVAIKFKLPDGWQAIDPDEAGAPGAAFVAVHFATDQQGFTTNITIDGQHLPITSSTEDVADESISRLHEVSTTVSLSDRRSFGSPDSPGLTQTLRVTAPGQPAELLQCQVYIPMIGADQIVGQAVIRLSLTATEEHFHTVIEDFQEFIRSVEPDT